ncbi:aminotransferase class I/II-fold pyridoxal phosphate-dependent enzyme, partial [Eubacteriales bacterium OttesenSCG-928-K08]|nr:aminotransferase class I/II-fold pyridoxal phosphate-dependent enzyme [Eubacteriales bacterium OttesenSCG-928-K08]
RRFMVDTFNEIGLLCAEPEGALYTFPSIRSTGLSSAEFCARLLKEQNVAAVPGAAFGSSGEGFIRCSYIAEFEQIREALERIKHFIAGL